MKKIKLNNKKIIKLVLVVICVGIVGAGGYFWAYPKISQKTVAPEEAVNSALAYINEVLLREITEAKLVGDVEEEAGLYKFQIEVGGKKLISYVTKDGKIWFPEAFKIDSAEERAAEEKIKEESITLGNFTKSGDEICKENGKPIIYFFGSQGCSYCKWEHPIIKAVAEKFTDFIVFHDNMDTNEDMDIFSEYSTGGVPTLVLGCKYSRVGAGVQAGEEQESNDLTALICDLTNGQPENVCLTD